MSETLTSRTGRAARFARYLLLPSAIVVFVLATSFPTVAEKVYGAWAYPRIAALLGIVTGRVPFSVAEVGLAAAIVAAAVGLVRWHRHRVAAREVMFRLARGAWVTAGVLAVWFLLAWGLNYARPPLAPRLELPITAGTAGEGTSVTADEVLELGRASVAATNVAYSELGARNDEPTQLPMSFRALGVEIDGAMSRLAHVDDALPGFRRVGVVARAKRPLLSTAMAYAGISGIFVPFTGEPSINALQPAVSMPTAVAHEFAHRWGVTDEGEASLVALLACTRPAAHPYLRYAAFLIAASRLLGASSRYLADESSAAYAGLGDGPRSDLEAIRDFWAEYRGPAMRVSRRVNDAYLKGMGVPGGVESYDRVVVLLVGAHRRGGLFDPAEGAAVTRSRTR